MRRYWLEIEKKQGDQFVFEGEIFHHIFDVCRQGLESEFEVLCGTHIAYLVRVIKLEKKRAYAEIISERLVPPIAKPHIHLALSIPRNQKMDLILEKIVELGTFAIHPFVSEFSFVRKVSEVSEEKMHRWEKIVKSATQQCGRGDLMNIAPVSTMEKILKEFNQKPNAAGLFAYEGMGEVALYPFLKNLERTHLEEVWVFIGSEGGFSHKEVLDFQQVGLKAVTLGDQVLRVETACLALIAILKYELSGGQQHE